MLLFLNHRRWLALVKATAPTSRRSLKLGYSLCSAPIWALTSGVLFVRGGLSPWQLALPCALVAWLLGLDAWRRWMKTEWGLFGPP